MEIHTTRFGTLSVDAHDVIHFPQGLLGLADCRNWVLLADPKNNALAWMQSIDRPEVALAVVSPRRFVPAYQVRVARRELLPMEPGEARTAEVLVILSKAENTLTLNLKAPLLIDLDRRVGCQVVGNGDLPVRYELGSELPTLKRSA
jgi:flagellar assembly factor FliW